MADSTASQDSKFFLMELKVFNKCSFFSYHVMKWVNIHKSYSVSQYFPMLAIKVMCQ